jgi:hypothetical protein
MYKFIMTRLREGHELRKLIDLKTYIGVTEGLEHGFLLKFFDF